MRNGFRAVISLGFSCLVLFKFVLPALDAGVNPVLYAYVCTLVIAAWTFALTSGFSLRSCVAFFSTLAALTLATVLGYFYTVFASLTGVGSEEAYFLQMGDASLDMRGIFLAGLLVGTLGVLDDVTLTQASIVRELYKGQGFGSLYTRAMVVGKDHAAALINTLVLAYVGAGLSFFVLLYKSNTNIFRLLDSEAFLQEIIRAAVGSLGILAALPFTTIIMVLALKHYFRSSLKPV